MEAFVPGSLFYAVLPADEGWIVISADVWQTGTTLQLTDLDFRPLETRNLNIGPVAIRRMRQALEEQALEQGYTELTIEGMRMSGRNPNRAIKYVRGLR